MLKVVIDTNVLVSALLKPDSVPDLILSLVLEGEIILCLSEPIATEYEEVLRREKFKKLNQRKVRELLSGSDHKPNGSNRRFISRSPWPIRKTASSWNAPRKPGRIFLSPGT